MFVDLMDLEVRVWPLLQGSDALGPSCSLLGLHVHFLRVVDTTSPCPGNSRAGVGVPCRTMGAA